jgi:ParB family chromosome partitioning protein
MTSEPRSLTVATRTPAKGRLGRGLGSLIPSAADRAETTEQGTFFECAIDRIEAMPSQPRSRFDEESLQELAASIRENGIIQPLIVRATDDGTLRLIAGERRLRAARLVGLERVPVVVREAEGEDDYALALIENIQRADLDPIEEAKAFERLIAEHAFTQDELAQRVGKSRSAVANALRLLRLPDPIRALLADGSLSAGHARAILSADPADQPTLAERILTEGLTVREAEQLSRDLRDPPAPVPPPAPIAPPDVAAENPPARRTAPRASALDEPPMSPELDNLVRSLQRKVGLKVEIVERPDTSGSITFFFADREALNAFVETLLPSS